MAGNILRYIERSVVKGFMIQTMDVPFSKPRTTEDFEQGFVNPVDSYLFHSANIC